MTEKFPPEVIKELGYYVYRLIDPRNGDTFYVGKGKDNRVFEHIDEKIGESDDELNSKLNRIREIKRDGFATQHVIHRHGLDEATAFEVEAALIQAYPGATNIAGGHNNADRGAAHSKQIIQLYKAEEVDFKSDKIVEININREIENRSIYSATRFCWRLDRKRAEQADLVLAVFQGLVVGVFKPEKWLDVTSENFPDFEIEDAIKNRIGFIGVEASDDIKQRYLQKRMPKRPRGAANPIRYHNI